MRRDLFAPLRGNEGIALVTTFVILLIMTVLGVGAVAVTALENRIAGFQRTGESAASAAESCVGTSVNIIKQTLATSNLTVPAAFVSATGPILTAAEVAAIPSLSTEISGQKQNDSDMVTNTGASGPDYNQLINGYNVSGDIDFMYSTPKAGTDPSNPDLPLGIDMVYRIDCQSTGAGGTQSRVVAIYICTLNGSQCQK